VTTAHLSERALSAGRFSAGVASILAAAERHGRFECCCVLTLLLLAFYPHDRWFTSLPLSVLTVLGLTFSALIEQSVFWVLAAVPIVWGVAFDWHSADNHKYLQAYWCLAIACATRCTNKQKALASTACYLIGAVFLIAALRKVFSADYLDGSFFLYELLFDGRFQRVAALFGGMPPHLVTFNETARKALTSYDSNLTSVSLELAGNLRGLAWLMTWWGLALETLIAAAFLIPERHALSRARNPLLLLFLLSSYWAAPVIGFGWVLAIMAIATTRDDEQYSRIAYLVTVIVLQLYRIPWSPAPR
jgi:hypothetical protein